LAIRILGEVTREQVQILQRADAIYIEEIRTAGLYDQISQAFAALLPVRAVGVQGDRRTYEQVTILNVVSTVFRTELTRFSLDHCSSCCADRRLYDSRLVRSSLIFVGSTCVSKQENVSRFDFPPAVMKKISSRITNEVAGVNRVMYDVSSKPPGTVELL
jgi:GMP synthase (glutamine-hydrolysing)